MRTNRWLPVLVMLGWTVGEINPSAPGCALNCWENTKYVTKCAGDHACLCSDPNYQNVSVFQCIYSQCDTVHFGSGLHHAITQCYGTSNEGFFAVPPIPNRDSLRRREEEYVAGAKLYGSGSAAGHPTESAGFPTQSAGGPYSTSPTASLPFPYFPLNTATSPAIATAAPTEPAYNALPVSTNSAASQIVTSGASPIRSNISIIVLCTATTFYLLL